MTQQTNRRSMAVVLCFAILISAAILRYVKTAPLFYVGLTAFVLCLFLSYSLRHSTFWKVLFFNLGTLMLLGGAADAYFTWFGASIIKEGDIHTEEHYLRGMEYYITDAARGYAAAPNVKQRIKKSLRDRVLYDVVYTINRDGLRIAPHDLTKSDDDRQSPYENAVFFGDSFTFGEGLNDDETLPYLFEQLSAGRYRSYNFGFHGYGAQQMLRIIETGLLENTVGDRHPMVVVYEALIQHIERASGKLIWDARVPRYELSPSGIAQYAGTFADDPHLAENLKYTKSASLPGPRLLAALVGANRTREDRKLFIQIVLQARQALETKYKARFYVLVWPLGDRDSSAVVDELKRNGVDVLTVDQVFTQYPDPPENYHIPVDNHPTALANERLAKYLLQYIH